MRTLGFRRPTKQQWEVLVPVSQAALERAEVPAEQIDWYVQAGSRPNACVAGRRSVAVTDRALESFLAGRLSHDQLEAVLLHELGHVVDGASSLGLTIWWLATLAGSRFDSSSE